MTLKGSMWDPRDVGNVLYLYCVSISVSWLWYCTMVLQDVITGVRSTQDLLQLHENLQLSINKKYNKKKKTTSELGMQRGLKDRSGAAWR